MSTVRHRKCILTRSCTEGISSAGRSPAPARCPASSQRDDDVTWLQSLVPFAHFFLFVCMFVTVTGPFEQLVSGSLQQNLFVFVCLCVVLNVLDLQTVGCIEKHHNHNHFLFLEQIPVSSNIMCNNVSSRGLTINIKNNV